MKNLNNLRDKIHGLNDFMVAAGNALEARDIDTLEALDNISNGWLQTEEERRAQETMLNAMMEAVYEMEALDDEDD